MCVCGSWEGGGAGWDLLGLLDFLDLPLVDFEQLKKSSIQLGVTSAFYNIIVTTGEC